MSIRTIVRAAAACAALASPLALGPAAPAGAEESSFVVEEVDASNFPSVHALVAGPSVGGDLDQAFTVVEDGKERVVDVVRLRGEDLHVAVVVDLSGSMAGVPIDQAKTAITALVGDLPADAQVAVVGFNDEARVLQDFTADRDQILSTVSRLAAEGETTLYDGIALGLDRLDEATKIGGDRALVVLSDGKDTASAGSVDALVTRLQGMRETTTSIVTLQTPDYDGAIAAQLAASAHGDAIPVVDATGLSQAFARVAERLGNLYGLRWRSASEGTDADVTISVAGRTGLSLVADFDHPEVKGFVPDYALETTTVARPHALLAATWVPYVAAALVSSGALVLCLLMRSNTERTRRREERKASRQSDKEQRRTMVSGVADRLTDLSQSVLESNGRGRSLDDKLDRAGLALRSGEFVAFGVACAAASLAVGLFLFGLPFGAVMIAAPAGLLPLTLEVLIARRRKKFVEQLGDTLQLMAGSLTAGYGLGQTLDSVAREASSPTAEEFSRVVMETRLGRGLDEALDAMSIRIGSPDFDWVVDAIKIQSSVGGNLSEIIQQVGETIRARSRVRRQVNALTAEGKISALVLFALPFCLTAFISVSNPTYVAPLFGTTTGWLMLGVAGTLMTAGGLWLRKLVNPEF